MLLWVKYVPAVFVSLCVNYPVYISPVFWVWFRLLPDLTVSGAPSPRFVLFVFWIVFICSCICLSRGKEVATRPPAIAHCRTAWEFGGDRCECRESSCPPIAWDIRHRRCSPKPAGGLPSSRVAAPPGAPFAGDHATGSPLTQCPPDRRWLMPAGLPLTQAHRIGADSCPLAAAYPSPVESPHVTARSAVCLFCCAILTF